MLASRLSGLLSRIAKKLGAAKPPQEVIAPELVLAEIANALWKYVRVNRLLKDTAEALLMQAPRAFARILPLEDSARRV